VGFSFLLPALVTRNLSFILALVTKALLVALALAASAFGQTPPPLAEIVSRLGAMNEARNAALKGYSATRTYEVSYKGFPKDLTAKAVVHLDFTAPDNKQFTIVSQEGSKLLVNRVVRKALESEQEAAKPEFRLRSALSEDNYKFAFVSTGNEAGRPCYLLDVTPKRDDKYLYDGRICVDTADYAVVRIDAKPAKNPSFWINKASIDSRSQKVGDFWLPAALRSRSHVRLGGDAELNITYTDYKITSATAVSSVIPPNTAIH